MSKTKTAPSEYAAIVRRFARVFAISETKARAEIAARTKPGERPITCARALNRYAIHKCFRISVFAEPPCAFTASDCDYYLQDARKQEAAE